MPYFQYGYKLKENGDVEKVPNVDNFRFEFSVSNDFDFNFDITKPIHFGYGENINSDDVFKILTDEEFNEIKNNEIKIRKNILLKNLKEEYNEKLKSEFNYKNVDFKYDSYILNLINSKFISLYLLKFKFEPFEIIGSNNFIIINNLNEFNEFCKNLINHIDSINNYYADKLKKILNSNSFDELEKVN